MRSHLIDGQQCYTLLEKSRDGGLIINTLVPAEDGEYYNYREWIGAGREASEESKEQGRTLAREKYAALDEAAVRERVTLAKQPGISGGLHGK